jgi:spore maturation protein CgeB
MSTRPPKILAITSAASLDFQYGCTPAWWQLWKGMYEAGVDLIVTPYRGPAVQSPWWRTEPNPCYREGEAFAAARGLVARSKGDTQIRRAEDNPDDTTVDKATREVIWRWITPRWRKHIEKILEREKDIDAVIVFGVPMNHFRGIPEAIRARFDIPIVYYDGDVPMSLPEFGGMDSGFNIYHGADPSEYDLLISNSDGGIPRLLEMGARHAVPLYWGADPDFFKPMPVEKRCDVFFYGHGDKFRRDWVGSMVGEPSRTLPDVDFVMGGGDYKGDTGRARELPGIPFNAFAEAISAARINLNVTRKSHATVTRSSTCRPFELAACGATIVSNPHEGIDAWFTPGEEIMVVHSADEATEAYRNLLGDPAQALAMGERARQRVLDEHTYAQRAKSLLALLGLGVAS